MVAMITVEDFRYVMNMEKAQELRASGIPPEEALRLAGVEFKTSRRGPGRPFTHEEAVEHFRQDDLRNEQVRRQVEREKTTRLLKPVFSSCRFFSQSSSPSLSPTFGIWYSQQIASRCSGQESRNPS